MVYKTTSIKPVIARIIRTARLTDLTYADNIKEWIGEAMDRMIVRWRLDKTYKDIEIKNHIGDLPCGLVSLSAVIYNGRRLRKGTNTIDPRINKWKHVASDIDSYFVSALGTKPEDVNQQNYSLVRGDNVKLVTQNLDQADYYDLEYDTIKTSFETGTITIAYKTLPLDKFGYPRIPDLEEARAAIFWYVCAQLLFTGYKLPLASMTFEYCDAKAERFFRKAKNIIKTQSEDEKEATVRLANNLIPPAHYYESFFINGEQPKYME